MIPRRVTLEGFLCYGGRQEIDLSDAGLCMLSGPNGAGKSSVFDAMTFALFGEHRGGRQDHEDLVHTGRDGAAVEFEFDLDGQAWRVRRTVRRKVKSGAATPDHRVQLSRWNAPAGKWEVVPETSNHREFKQWVAQHVGLTAETFTCSMLLRQGEADRLLGVAPAGRFAVLAGVVGLDRYQRLAARAQARRKQAERELDGLDAHLRELAPVGADALREAGEQADAAGSAAEAVGNRVESLRVLHAQAAQWADLDARLRDARARREACGQVLARADQIEAGWRRITELRAVLPPLRQLRQQRQQSDECARRSGGLERQRGQKQQEQSHAETALEELRRQCDAAAGAVEAQQQRERAAEQRQAALGRTLAAAAAYERHASDLAALRRNLTSLPPDPAADLQLAQAAHDELAALQAALPALQRLAEHRDASTAVADVLRQTAEARQSHAAEAGQANALLAGVRRDVEAAEAALRDAHDAATRAKARAESDRQAWTALQQTAGRAECPACGQPLTDEHRGREAARRQEQLRAAESARQQADQARQSAEAEYRRRGQTLTRLESRARALSDRGRDLAHAEQQARRDLAHHEAEARRAAGELPEPLRARAAADGAGPTPKDLAALTQQARGLASARQRLRDAHGLHTRWLELTAKANALADSLAAKPADLPTDLAPLRAEAARLAAERQSLAQSLAAHRTQLAARQADQQRLADRLAQLRRELGDLDLQLAEEQIRRQHLDAAVRQTLQHLPSHWPPRLAGAGAEELFRHLSALEPEAAALESAHVERDHQQLQQARAEAGQLDARLAELAADADRLPPEARQDPAALAAQLDAARAERDACETARRDAERRRDQLADQHARRLDLQHRHAAAARRHRLCSTLETLLGRTGLQLHLIRRAEREIVHFANQTLDRLSGGDLTLRLRSEQPLQLRSGQALHLPTAPGNGDGATATAHNAEDDADTALDLEAIPRRCGAARPVPVAMLSGSQKFRAAVALALAIGQYAHGRHRCGECVIIDEGFGSLDAPGQQTMIEELHNLRGLLKRIILVSHQETFAAAFPHGYRFRLENGETRVERISG